MVEITDFVAAHLYFSPRWMRWLCGYRQTQKHRQCQLKHMFVAHLREPNPILMVNY